jgi:hypothetical protein
MSNREGKGYVPGLGEFRPAPYLCGQDPWREIRNILSGLGDDHGRSGPEALINRLRSIALQAAWEAVFNQIGFRWQEMSDQQWFEKALEEVNNLREIYYRGSPKNIDDYIQNAKDYQTVYARLAALLLVWAEAVRFREYQKEVAMKQQ